MCGACNPSMARDLAHSLYEFALALPDIGIIRLRIRRIGQESARGAHGRDRVMNTTAHNLLAFSHSGNVEQRKRKLELRTNKFRLGGLSVHMGAFAVCD